MLSFTSARGNLFPRLGTVGNLIANADAFQALQVTSMTDTTTGVVSQFDAESDLQAIMGSNYISLANSAGSGFGSIAQQLASATVNRMVFRDQPQYNQNLTQGNTLTSILEVIRQMNLAGATVLAQTVTATPAPFNGTGNGQVSVSVRRPSDGRVLESAFAETVTATCTQDSYIGGATRGNEGFFVSGVGSETNLFAFDWPLGSNAAQSINAIDGNSDDSNGNLLTNSGFEEWTANVPDNWELMAGTAGTTISEENTIVYDGVASLAITGDAGGTLTEIRQLFDSSVGTTGTVSPLTQYSFNLWIRRDGVAPGAGTLVVRLGDADGNTLQDMAGNDCSYTITLNPLTTEFAAYSGQFRLPIILPDEVYVYLGLGVALTSGRTVYIDKASMGQMTQLGVHEPFVAIHSGSTPFVTNDYAQIAVTNSRGAGGTLNTWQTALYRMLFAEVYSNEILFPSSATPSISDSLLLVNT